MKAIGAIPVFQVTDVDRTVAFYRDALGFELFYAEGGFAILRRDAVSIHLTGAPDESWRRREAALGTSPVVSGAESFLAGTATCLIQVDGVDELYESVEPLGVVHPNAPIEDTPYGTREFGVLDPDGNGITLFERR
jgi:catechol 2,3-dioxygenase-like lactoylglutathione lyase family enzyme